jgi:hypothetical protein
MEDGVTELEMERFLDDLEEATANNQSLLTIIMPNGKTLKDCTFDELSDIIERLMELGAKGNLKGQEQIAFTAARFLLRLYNKLIMMQ